MTNVTRRHLLGAAGVATAAAVTAGSAWRGVAAGLERRKNLLLVIIDSLRADHLGCYGNRVVQTPTIDALAAQGMRFTRVYPTAMPTVPARRSLMTGSRVFPFHGWQPWDGLGRTPGWAPILPGEATLATELRRRGYWTGYVTDNPFLAYAPPFRPFRESFHRFLTQGGQGAISVPDSELAEVDAERARRTLPVRYQDRKHIQAMRRYMATNGARLPTIDEDEIAAARVFRTAEDVLRAAVSRRPFLIVVDSFDPHEPWVIPSRYLDLYRSPDDDAPALGDTEYGAPEILTADELRRLRTTYAANVTLVDHWLGRLLDRLRTMRLADSTVVMLVSDHGFLLGEHQWVGKSAWHLYPGMINVPLIVRHPDGRGAGASSDWFASTHDVAPTLLSLGRTRPSDAFEGTDLAPLLSGSQPAQPRTIAYGGYSNHFFARTDRWAFVSENHGAGSKLFDLSVDPDERHDLSASRADVVDTLYERVVEEVGSVPPAYTRAEMDAPPRFLHAG